jgi:hypothetical protein
VVKEEEELWVPGALVRSLAAALVAVVSAVAALAAVEAEASVVLAVAASAAVVPAADGNFFSLQLPVISNQF